MSGAFMERGFSASVKLRLLTNIWEIEIRTTLTKEWKKKVVKSQCTSYFEFQQEKKTQINMTIEVNKSNTTEEGKQQLEGTNIDKNNSKVRHYNF